MAATTTTVYQQDTAFSRESTSPLEYKEILVETPSTADATNTFTVNLAEYGITKFTSIKPWYHSTPNSVVTTGTAATTSVTDGVLTVTMGATGDNVKYVFLIGGY